MKTTRVKRLAYCDCRSHHLTLCHRL